MRTTTRLRTTTKKKHTTAERAVRPAAARASVRRSESTRRRSPNPRARDGRRRARRNAAAAVTVFDHDRWVGANNPIQTGRYKKQRLSDTGPMRAVTENEVSLVISTRSLVYDSKQMIGQKVDAFIWCDCISLLSEAKCGGTSVASRTRMRKDLRRTTSAWNSRGVCGSAGLRPMSDGSTKRRHKTMLRP